MESSLKSLQQQQQKDTKAVLVQCVLVSAAKKPKRAKVSYTLYNKAILINLRRPLKRECPLNIHWYNFLCPFFKKWLDVENGPGRALTAFYFVVNSCFYGALYTFVIYLHLMMIYLKKASDLIKCNLNPWKTFTIMWTATIDD